MTDLTDSPPGPAETLAALDAWRKSLINLTGHNRALNFRHTTSTLSISSPTADEVVAQLQSGNKWSFSGLSESGDEDAADDADWEWPTSAGGPPVHCRRAEKTLGPALRLMTKRAHAELQERGLNVMYLACGFLKWQEEDGDSFDSPMILVPVELIATGPKTKPYMQLGDEDIVVNPSLALRLEEFRVELPELPDTAERDWIHRYLERVRQSIRRHPRWLVEDEVVLAPFSFHKEVMYRDLLDNAVEIAAHPIVEALAHQNPLTQTDAFQFDEIPPDRIDVDAPAEDTPLVLSADSSQRACVAAAVAGRSFVMDGPPGTGKSQTIANVIGSLMYAGKSVLFVSEKAAALEVVRNRLDEVGLSQYVLELHSHKTSRKEVAKQLVDALDNVPVAPPGMSSSEREAARRYREQLNGYAQAMNVERPDIDSSLHDLLGEISKLEDVPSAPTPDIRAALTAEALRDIETVCGRLGRAWRPAAEGQSFLWRGVIDRTSLDSRLSLAQLALQKLTGIIHQNPVLTAAFDLHRISNVPTIVRLLAAIDSRPAKFEESWLSDAELPPLEAAVADLSQLQQRFEAAATAVRQLSGVEWSQLPAPDEVPVYRAPPDDPVPLVDIGWMTQGDLNELQIALSADVDLFGGRAHTIWQIASTMGIPAPTNLGQVLTVLDVTRLGFAEHRPEPWWVSADGMRNVRAAAAELRARSGDLNQTEAAASTLFRESAAGQPLDDLYERFTSVHRGLRKLSSGYRQDKQTVAALKLEVVTLEQAIADLGKAVAWSRSAKAFDAAAAHHAALLGRYWKGRATDFGAVDSAIGVAEHLLAMLPPPLIPAAAAQVSAGSSDRALLAFVDESHAAFREWQEQATASPMRRARPEITIRPMADIRRWIQAMRDAAAAAHHCVELVTRATGSTSSYVECRRIVDRIGETLRARNELNSRDQAFRDALGPQMYSGPDCDAAELVASLDWTRRVRLLGSLNAAPLTVDQSKGLERARPTPQLLPVYDEWTAAAESVIRAFAPERHHDLAIELDDYESARELLTDLRNDGGGQEEWFAYRDDRQTLERHHLAGVLDFCIRQRLTGQDLWPVMRRAVFRAWADKILGADPALRPVRADERSELVTQFRQLDERLVPAATSQILSAVNARRPRRTDLGEPALIKRQGALKTRHMPVRELLKKTEHTTLAVKPCFMMSPLTVSQYLAPSMKFDVVVFDEASQISPGDAINCVYRGSAVILAGDDRQLPPTSFFDRVTAADEGDEDTDVVDFPSILELARASGAFRNLQLKWHYRSRHEGLIAFSNHRFYDGKLITFPSAQIDGPDVGVTLQFVEDGVYQRGTTRTNPREAAAVAQRVVHHLQTRPEATLGVVTFSVAQADAIDAAVDRALDDRPELRERLSDNRLSGFFVKSLESVQGDERDVMIFSIGYGPDENGHITTNFGALNRDKGWRRLNVAITRARQRVEVISSVRAGSIPETTNVNIRHLRAYLDYAERGMNALALELGSAGLGTESPFEDSVLDVIRGFGYEVQPQVGAAGYRIDLGVRHPSVPGVFALGVECDGAMYHSSPAARDRDRLREELLVGLGWRLHRIWGTAWYRDRTREESRLRQAIEDAVAAPISGRLSTPKPVDRPVVTTVPIDTFSEQDWTTTYVPARVSKLPLWTDPSADGSHHDMVEAVEAVARQEGPIHYDLLVKRLREAWGIGRAGSLIRANISRAINAAHVVVDEEFVDVPGNEVTCARVPDGRGEVRTAAQVSKAELRLTLLTLLQHSGSITDDQLIVAVARVFAWNRVGHDIRSRLEEVINDLLASGAIQRESGLLRATHR